MYKTKFYARTWIMWVCFCFFGHFALSLAIVGPVVCFGLIPRADGRQLELEETIAMNTSILVCFFAFLSLFIAVAVNLSYRQKPILFIRKEGIEMRTIGMVFHSLGLSALGLPLLPFEFCWKLFTGRLIQTQTTRLPWEFIYDINCERGSLYIFYISVVEDGSWVDENPFFFGADAFGVSTETVGASLLHFAHNIAERENLSSWDNTEEVFEIN